MVSTQRRASTRSTTALAAGAVIGLAVALTIPATVNAQSSPDLSFVSMPVTEERVGWPMRPYTLDEVSVRLDRLGCERDCPRYTILLSGRGGAGFSGIEGDPEVQAQNRFVGTEAVIELVERLYQERFFDLHPEYRRRFGGLSVRDGGRVSGYSMVNFNGATQSITVKLGEYEKRVGWSAKTLPLLDELATLIEETAGAQEWLAGR